MLAVIFSLAMAQWNQYLLENQAESLQTKSPEPTSFTATKEIYPQSNFFGTFVIVLVIGAIFLIIGFLASFLIVRKRITYTSNLDAFDIQEMSDFDE